ncbi:MAG: chemotaxis protein CheA, partial [Caulobacteraceae bacterium]
LSPREPWGSLADYDPYSCNLVFEAVFDAKRAEIEAAFRYVADQVEIIDLAASEPKAAAASPSGAKTLRVEAARVDHLANLTDDLVVAKSGLSEMAAWAERLSEGQALSEALRHQQARLDRLVNELHAAVGRIRLVPLSTLFDRLPRLTREIAQALDKDVALQIAGGAVEVDKAIVDGLFEPLLHVLRNAIDHGVESRDVRHRLAKPGTATIRLTARTVSDQVVIEVSDDGAGIDVARVRALAVDRSLLTQEAVDRLDDQAAIDLIFTPGFSTAAAISSVSGRGVGMDIVREAAAQSGGSVAVLSEKGRGSTIRFSLPVTMSLTKIMVVTCGSDRFGLALDAVVETVRVPPDQVIAVRSSRAFMRRGRAIPLIALSQALGGPISEAKAAQQVVVADVNGEQVGFAIDAVVDRLDVVVRPMTGLLAGVRGVSGATLMRDGGVLMILNLAEVLA